MRINRKILFLALLGVLVLPSMALAVVTVQTIVDSAVKLTLYIASGVTVILWVVTGILFLTAQGDPSKLTAGKTALISAIAGTLIVILATAAMNIVTSAFGL